MYFEFACMVFCRFWEPINKLKKQKKQKKKQQQQHDQQQKRPPTIVKADSMTIHMEPMSALDNKDKLLTNTRNIGTSTVLCVFLPLSKLELDCTRRPLARESDFRQEVLERSLAWTRGEDPAN